VRLVEGVVARALVDLPQPLGHLGLGPGCPAAVEELRLELGHRLPVLLPDRLPQVVGLGSREARDLLGDLHGLLLVEDHALGGLDDRAQALVGDLHRVGVALAPGVDGDLVHRPRSVERDQRHQVVELRRAHLLQRLAHPLGLELEHAD
jgi:hypothetical protein